MSDPTYVDILEQGPSLLDTVALLERTDLPDVATGPRRLVFTGCGSSVYAAAAGAALARVLAPIDAVAMPASEAWLLADQHLSPDVVLIAFSRTGTTTETVRAVERARELGASTIGVSLAADSPVLALADAGVDLSHVDERGRVMMRSFSNLLLVAQWLAIEVAGARGADVGDYRHGLRTVADQVATDLQALDRQAREVVALGLEHYVFLGAGPIEPICADSVLKIQEMTQLPSESYSPLEFRHGPIATLTERTAVLIASNRRSAAFDRVVLDDVELLGGRSWLVGPPTDGVPASVVQVESPTEVPDWLQGNYALALFQLIAYHQTVALGHDPQSVRHLDRTKEPHVNPHVLEIDSVLPPT